MFPPAPWAQTKTTPFPAPPVAGSKTAEVSSLPTGTRHSPLTGCRSRSDIISNLSSARGARDSCSPAFHAILLPADLLGWRGVSCRRLRLAGPPAGFRRDGCPPGHPAAERVADPGHKRRHGERVEGRRHTRGRRRTHGSRVRARARPSTLAIRASER